jgi:hypothetical protein
LPIRVVAKTKLRSDGKVDKLKIRIAIRAPRPPPLATAGMVPGAGIDMNNGKRVDIQTVNQRLMRELTSF